MDDDELDAQIAALQAKKAARDAARAREAARQEREAAKVLVGGTPTKPKLTPAPAPRAPSQPILTSAGPTAGPSRPFRPPRPAAAEHAPPPRPSNFAAALAARRAKAVGAASLPTITRTTSLKERSAVRSVPETNGDGSDTELEVVRTGAERADDLTVEHELTLGPGEFGKDPEGEEVWRNLEPNSGIRLRERVLPHDEVQDHLYGRYYLRPPQVYSIARLSRDGATYDIPVEGDWITIAVVAERGDIKVSGTKDVAGPDNGDDSDGEEGEGLQRKSRDTQAKDKIGKDGKGKPAKARKRPPRKYINLKLVALPPRNKSLGTAISGDAIFQLLLFESDAVVCKEVDGQEQREYRGGSGGAYEKWHNLAVGSVVALLNPRVLRPLRAGSQAPHPLTLPMALNPPSADSISLIGHAQDLGRCTALQADASRCRSWVDTRLGMVCEYHVHAAVKRGRASRAEFASATTSYELMTRGGGGGGSGRGGGFGRGGAASDYDKYDPRRKRGLLPANGPMAAPRGSEDGGGGATYVVGGKVARTGHAPLGYGADAALTDKLGRVTSLKRKRRMEEKEAEAAMERLFARDKNDSIGAKYLGAVKSKGEKEEGGSKCGTGTEDRDRAASSSSTPSEPQKRVFSAAAIQRIGFDPTGRRDEDAEKRLAAIASLKEAGRTAKLGRPAGPKRRNVNVSVPVRQVRAEVDNEPDMVDLD